MSQNPWVAVLCFVTVAQGETNSAVGQSELAVEAESIEVPVATSVEDELSAKGRATRLYLRGEALVWKRRRVDERGFVFSAADNSRLLDTTRWDTPFAEGARFTLGWQVSQRSAIELIGAFDNEFRDTTSIASAPGSIRQPFFGHAAYGPPTPQIGNQPALVELEYQSQWYSIELSARHFLSDSDRPVRVGLVLGPRFFSYEEQFQDYDNATLVRGAAATDSVYQTRVSNDLWGGVLGTVIEARPCDRLSIESGIKWGGFANVTDAHNQLALQSGQVFFDDSTPETRFSGLVEIGLYARWRAHRRIVVQVGYSAMYFWNMTSSPDVLSFNLRQQSKQNNELAFWVHGPTAGLEFRY